MFLVTLLKGLKDITKSSRTLKETHDDYTRFTMKRATYSDGGTYCLVARNRHGADRAFVHVMVNYFNRKYLLNFTNYIFFPFNYFIYSYMAY